MQGPSLENQFICRACLKIVELPIQSFGYIDDATGNLRDMLMCCVPEMDIYVSINPIVCMQCIQTLINVQNFKSRCINTESIIRTYMKKYNLSDKNPINLGSVVRDLIEINKFYKQQEEKRRQHAMAQYAMQQRNNAVQSPFPPPLHFSNGTVPENSNHPREYPKISSPSFTESSARPTQPIGHTPQHLKHIPYTTYSPATVSAPPTIPLQPVPSTVTFHSLPPPVPSGIIPHTSSIDSGHPSNPFINLGSIPPNVPLGTVSLGYIPMGPLKSIFSTAPLGSSSSGSIPSIGPVRPLESFGLHQRLDALHPQFSNGLNIPSHSNGISFHQNAEQSSPNVNEMLVTSSTDVIPAGTDNNSNNINHEETEENNAPTQNNNESDKETTTYNKIKFHPIESKLRLVISIPRHKISIPLDETNLDDEIDQEMESSNDNEFSNDQEMESSNDNEDVNGIKPTDDEMYPILDQIVADIPEDIPEDLPEYLEDYSINQMYNTEEEDTSPHKNITKFFSCSCMYLTTSETLFGEHKKRCKSGKKNMVKCPHCPHITNRVYALNKHINTMHTKAVWYLCDFCTYRSTDKSCLRRHVRKNHEEKTDGDANKHFFCQLCSLIISTEYNYNRHMMKHDDSNNVSSYDCEFCSYHTKDRSNFRKHIFTHCPVQLQCPNCPYTNVSPYQLRSHIKKYHDGAGIEVADCKSETPVNEIIIDIKEMLSNVKGDQGNECS